MIGAVKMNEKKNEITSIHLMGFVVAGQIGIGILTLPSLFAQKAGHDGWILTLLAGVICLILVMPVMLLLKRYKNKHIYEINILIYGKFLGYVFNLIILLYLLFITGITLRIFSEAVNIIMLRLTPPIVITVLILTPSVYATIKELKVICRFDIFIFSAYFILIASLFLVFHNLRVTYILPIGEAGFKEIVKSIPSAVYSFLGFELSAIVYPYIKDKEKSIKCISAGIIFTTLFYAFLSVVATMLYGETKLKMLSIPIYSIYQSVAVPVIERLDTVFILFWFPTMGSTIRSYLFSTCCSAFKIFRINRWKPLVFLIAAVEIFISRIPKNYESALKYTTYSGIFGIIVVVFIIITYFISLFIKQEGAN